MFVSSIVIPNYMHGLLWDVFEELDEDCGFEVDLVEFRDVEPFEV